MKSCFLTYLNGNIHYTIQGKGRTIVFLHGFLESEVIWRDYAQKLSTQNRVICIDLPGHGKSDSFGYIHTMERMASVVKAVLKQYKIRKTLIIGHSMGGYVALAFAELYPYNLKGLCMFFSTAYEDSIEKKAIRTKAIQLAKQNHISFIRNTIPNLFSSNSIKLYKDEINSLIQSATKISQQGLIATIEGIKSRIDREIIVKYSPCLIHYIFGENDPVLDLKCHLPQTAIGYNVSHSIIKNCGHMGFIEAKDECLIHLKKFIRNCNKIKKT